MKKFLVSQKDLENILTEVGMKRRMLIIFYLWGMHQNISMFQIYLKCCN